MDEVLEEFAAEQERWAPGNKERFGPEGKRSSNLTESPTRHQKPQLSRPSDEMAEAMDVAGNPRPPGHATHHIVADADKRAAEARKILRKVDIEPRNDPRNGIHLPQDVSKPRTAPEAFTQHKTLHTDSYYDKVNHRLREAYTGTGHYKNSPILDPARRVENELARLYEDIANGHLPHPRKLD